MARRPSTNEPRIGVLVVAYNAERTLNRTLDRLPDEFVARISAILISDDASTDGTHSVAELYRSHSDLPITVVRQPQNLGYGGNQKFGYHWFMERGIDIVVLLHGDGQYAPEVISELTAPLTTGEADAAFGSRMMTPWGALRGGMPLYKFVGNRILTAFQNAVSGMHLSEWHSGYRAYRVDALADIPFDTYSDGFDFDTQIILGLRSAEKTLVEIAIPTYYGEEICYVNGLGYARDVAGHVLRERRRKVRAHSGSPDRPYQLKTGPHTSHGVLRRWLASTTPGLVLDVGCSDGRFAELIAQSGHTVDGVDLVKHEGVGERISTFVEADLNSGLPPEVSGPYDVVVAADVLEHVMEPSELLASFNMVLDTTGHVMISVPNFSHWYPRGKVSLGRFDYDERGLLDRGHLRFFTRRTLERMIRTCGFEIVDRAVVGTPWELLAPRGPWHRLISWIDRRLVRLWPGMFGYQFLYRLRRA